MNWYELATPDEVKEVLEELLATYRFVSYTYARDSEYDDNVKLINYPSQAYEMAEALWGEYREEVL